MGAKKEIREALSLPKLHWVWVSGERQWEAKHKNKIACVRERPEDWHWSIFLEMGGCSVFPMLLRNGSEPTLEAAKKSCEESGGHFDD